MQMKEIWALYYKRVIGIVAGIIFGIIYLFFGFWDMCFVILLVFTGYWLGKLNEEVQQRNSFTGMFSTFIEYVRKLFRPYQ